VQGSYTWGKSIDTSSTTACDSLSNSIASSTGSIEAESRSVGLNIGRKLVINGNLAGPSGKYALRAHCLGAEWVGAGGIFELSDGVPFTPLFGAGGTPWVEQ